MEVAKMNIESLSMVLMETQGKLITLESKVLGLEAKYAQLEGEKDELWNIVQKLLASSSEASIDMPVPAVAIDDHESIKPRTTRVSALAGLAERLAALSPALTVKGQGNRGRNQLRIVTEEGIEFPIYLAASRNYSDEGYSFSAWHTPQPDDVNNPEYKAFILSAEDEDGEPLYFVIGGDEMRRLVADKPVNGGFYHFYIGRSTSDSGRFVDHRGAEETDFTSYLNNWSALQD